MDDDEVDPGGHTHPPAEAFALLGDETRIGIIQALGEAGGEGRSFSELRERVGARDSGRFNYHLNKLVGTFVRKTDDGEYELSYAGSRVVGAILSGEYTRHGSADAFELDSACSNCETALSATYEDERVAIRCPTCDEQQSSFGFPPGGIEDRTPAELTQAFDDWLMTIFRLVSNGVCNNCVGKTSGRLTDDVPNVATDRPVSIVFVCERCASSATISVNSYLIYHPAVVAFHHDHGIDVSDVHTWTLEFVLDENLEIVSTDPWRVRSTLELDGDRLELLVEEDCSVRVDSEDDRDERNSPG